MHFLIWTILGCESRPQPGTPVVLVQSTDRQDKLLGTDQIEETIKNSENKNSENKNLESVDSENEVSEGENSEDDFFQDNSLEIPSINMNAEDTLSMESPSKDENTTIVNTETFNSIPKEASDAGNIGLMSDAPVVLVKLIEGSPPRGVLGLPSGEEIVVTAGSIIPEHNLVVWAVGTKSATLVKISANGDTSKMEPLHLSPLY